MSKFLILHSHLEQNWDEAAELFYKQVELERKIYKNKEREKEILNLIQKDKQEPEI